MYRYMLVLMLILSGCAEKELLIRKGAKCSFRGLEDQKLFITDHFHKGDRHIFVIFPNGDGKALNPKRIKTCDKPSKYADLWWDE